MELPISLQQHKQEAPTLLRIAVVTVSDTRTLENDLGGKLIEELVSAASYQVVSRQIIRDEADLLRSEVVRLVRSDAQAILMTGGTGIGSRDVTPEAIEPILERSIPGFGELFRYLSFQEIGAASMLSRAFAGVVEKKVLFAMPGSPAGVRLAMEQLILPELPHLVYHAGK